MPSLRRSPEHKKLRMEVAVGKYCIFFTVVYSSLCRIPVKRFSSSMAKDSSTILYYDNIDGACFATKQAVLLLARLGPGLHSPPMGGQKTLGSIRWQGHGTLMVPHKG